MSCTTAGKATFEPKDPDATLDYVFDWAQWLDGNDVITAHQIIIPTDLTLEQSLFTDTTVTAWLSGGTAFKIYPVTCRITTQAGRTDDRTAQLPIAQR